MKWNAKTEKVQNINVLHIDNKATITAILKTGYMNFESDMYLSENFYINVTLIKYIYIHICIHPYVFEGSILARIGLKTTRCKDCY